MPWQVLSEILVEVLKQFLSALAAELIDKLLPKAGVAPVPRSPRRLRRIVMAALNEAAAGQRNPLGVRLAVAGVMRRVNGVVMDRVWERLHARGVVPMVAWAAEAAGGDEREADDDLFAAIGLELVNPPPPVDVLAAFDAVVPAADGDEQEADDDTQEIVMPPAGE